jgi:hypothetical protein
MFVLACAILQFRAVDVKLKVGGTIWQMFALAARLPVEEAAKPVSVGDPLANS